MTAAVTDVPLAKKTRFKPAALPRTLISGGIILLFSLLLAFFPSWFAPYDPTVFDYNALLKGPSWAHPFGTDSYGRDVLSRVIHAYTIDMQIAVFATTGPFIIGTLVGALVGYAGGITEAIFGRVVDAVVTFPFLVLVIAVVSVLGPVAAEVKVQKRLDYADAGRVMGYTPMRIIFRHLLPNAITPAIVYWMTDMALAILLGSSLGYLGLGAQPPLAEWGVQIADGKNFMTTAWWIAVFPGVSIVLTGLGFSLAGDGVAELLRVRR
jgi:peptide/nickel transport system permease protein